MSDYRRFHRNRTNLAIHAAAVPVFALGALGALWAAAGGHWLTAVACLAAPLVSLAAQGYGHRQEAEPPLPFAGPGDFLGRILTEQFVTFPGFVLRGQWSEAWRAARRPSTERVSE